MKMKYLSLLFGVACFVLFNVVIFMKVASLYDPSRGVTCHGSYGWDSSVEVVFVVDAIEAGTVLEPDMVRTRAVPRQVLPAASLLAQELNIYLGLPVQKDISAEAMLMTTDFATGERRGEELLYYR